MNKFGPLFVSVVILGLYGAHAMGLGKPWADGDTNLMNMCLTLVMGYWLGSSSGSAAKNDIIGAPAVRTNNVDNVTVQK